MSYTPINGIATGRSEQATNKGRGDGPCGREIQDNGQAFNKDQGIKGSGKALASRKTTAALKKGLRKSLKRLGGLTRVSIFRRLRDDNRRDVTQPPASRIVD